MRRVTSLMLLLLFISFTAFSQNAGTKTAVQKSEAQKLAIQKAANETSAKLDVGGLSVSHQAKKANEDVIRILRGSTAYSRANEYSDGFYGNFDVDAPGTFNTVAVPVWGAYCGDFDAVNTAFFYACEYDSSRLIQVDVATGDFTVIGPTLQFNGMACDKSTGTFYAVTPTDLYTLDETTGATTLVGAMGNPGTMINLACDGDGNLYGIDISDDQLYSIDPATGAATVIGPAGYSANYAQSMSWDPESGQIYWGAYGGGLDGNLRLVDPVNGGSTLIGDMDGGKEVTVICFPGGVTQYTNDVGIQAVNEPTSGVDLTNAEPIQITIKNYGTASQSDIPWEVTFDGPVRETFNGVLPGPLADGETALVEVGTADLSVYGTYTFEACTQLAGDELVNNDCKTKLVVNAMPAYCDATTSTEDEWISNVLCGEIDNSSGWQGGVADYTDISTTILAGNSEPITVSNGTPYSSDKCTVWVDWGADYVFDIGTDEEFILTSDGTGAVFTGAIEVPGGTPQGEYRMRVRLTYSVDPQPCGSASYGEVEDYTIVVSEGVQNDLGVTAVLAPESGYYLSDAEEVTVTIKNFGSAAQSNFDVTYSFTLDNPVTETVTETIAPGESLDYTFAATADLSVIGGYTFNACTDLTGDENPDNDCSDKVVTNYEYGSITGSTKNANTNQALVGVLVEANGQSTTSSGGPFGAFYTLSDLPGGTYTVVASKDGFFTKTYSDVEVLPGEATSLNIALIPDIPVPLPFMETWDDSTFTANAWSFDPEQANWNVDVGNGNPAPSAEFHWSPSAENYEISMISRQFEGYTAKATEAVFFDYDLYLSNYDLATVEGMGVDLWDGTEWIEIANHDNQGGSIAWTTFSNDITGLVTGIDAFKVRFRAYGEDSFNINDWRIDNIHIYQATLVTFSGTITELSSGDPIEGATITLDNSRYEVQTGADGTYSMEIMAGTYDVTLTADGYNTVTVEGLEVSTDYVWDVAMTAPTLEVAPDSFAEELELDMSQDYTISVSNNGNGPVEWNANVQINSKDGNAVHIPAFNGIMNHGKGELSLGRAPHVNGNPQAGGTFQISRGSMGSAFNMYPGGDLIQFDTDDPTVFSSSIAVPNTVYAADFDQNNVFYAVDNDLAELYTVDLGSGAFTLVGSTLAVTDMAFDYTTNTMYAVDYDDVSNSLLYTMDLATGATTLVGDCGAGLIISLACDGNGDLYGFSISTDEIVSIDKATGAVTVIGAAGFDGNYAQSMAWDPMTDVIYMAAFNNSPQQGELRVVDKTTGATSLVGIFESSAEVCGLGFEAAPATQWISLDVTSGSLTGAKESQDITMTLNTEGLDLGQYYYADIVFSSSPDVGEVTVPVELFVTGDLAYFDGTVTDPASRAPVSGVSITADDGTNEFSTTTGPDGTYYLPVLAGTYNLTAEKANYLSQTVEDVTVALGETVTQDFMLDFTPPELLSAEGGYFDVTLNWAGNPILSDGARDDAKALATNVQEFGYKAPPTGVYDKSKFPDMTRQGGDSIEDAMVIPALPFNETGTTSGYINNYDEECTYSGSTAPDVVYSFTPAEDLVINIDLCGSSYDTKVYVYENEHTPGAPYACNDDYYGSGDPCGSWVSAIFDLYVAAGNTYYIVVDGYGANSGEYVIDVTGEPYVACVLECPAESIPEGEECAGDDYVDTYNAGCGADVPVFTPVNCGDVICGTGSTFVRDGSNYRDTDWYELVITEPQVVSFSVTAEFPVLAGLIEQIEPGVPGCDNITGYIAPYGSVAECEDLNLEMTLIPGTYYFFVAPSVFEGYPCGTSNKYIASWTCTETFVSYFNVYRDGVDIADVYGSSYVDSDVDPGNTYCYTVDQVYEPGMMTGVSNELCADVIYAPEIAVNPASLSEQLLADETSQQLLTIQNNGLGQLDFDVTVDIGNAMDNAVDLEETFESYTAGDPLAQQANAQGNMYWTTWSNDPGGAEDPLVSNEQAFEGDNSVVIETGNDCVLLLGDKTAGEYDLEFNMYVPTGNFGYFNVLHLFDGANSEWGIQVYFDADGAGHLDAVAADTVSFTYAYDTWIPVKLNVNLDADSATLYIDNNMLIEYQWSLGTFGDPGLNQLGAANFYAWDENGTPKYFIDNVTLTSIFEELWLSVTPLSGSVPGEQSTDLTVNFNSAGLLPGIYNGTISIGSNDPLTPMIDVPVDLEVMAETGTLMGYVTDATTRGPVQGVTITADGIRETTTTDENGYYEMELSVGSYNVTAEKDGYISQTAGPIAIEMGGSAQQDFMLEFAGPNLLYANGGIAEINLGWESNPSARGSVTLPSFSDKQQDVERLHGPTHKIEKSSGRAVGDDCTDPIVIGALPYYTTDSTCDRGNYTDTTCLGSYDGGEDIFYMFTLTEETAVSVTMETETTWTGMLLTDECPPSADCIATATNTGAGGSQIQRVLPAGTYYIMIDTWPSPDCIPEFNLAVETYNPCVVECPTGAIDEPEACGEDLNGGCNADVFAVTPISDGDVFCGTAWADGNSRDTDWYELVIDSPKTVTWSVTAEFPVYAFIIEGNFGCDGSYIMSVGQANACETAVAVADLPPGTYWLWVGNQGFADYPCGQSNNYVAEVTTEDTFVTYYNVIRDGEQIAQTYYETYTDTDIVPDTEYCYTVSQIIEPGLVTPESNELCATMLCEMGCDYTLNLTDSYGDGWNGAAVSIMQGTNTIGTYTLTSGSSGTAVITLCDAFETSLVWISGSYDSECGFEFLDPMGNVLTSFIAGDAPDPGEFFNFTTECPQMMEQQVVMEQDWNAWSSYINPDVRMGMDALMDPVIDEMIITKYFSEIYYPDYGINTMGDFSNQHGYFTKLSAAATLPISGYMADPTVNIPAGWSLFPVLQECSIPAADVFSAIPGFIIGWDPVGNGIYYPAEEMNTLGDLNPGMAYWIKVDADASYTYPGCTKASGNYSKSLRPVNNTSWNDVNFTPVNHAVIFDANATAGLQEGDMIGAFTTNNWCAGMAEFRGGNLGINLFGDDLTTDMADGYVEGEPVTFRVFRPATEEEFDMNVTYDYKAPNADGMFAINGISVVTDLKLSPTSIGENLLNGLNIYPNPSSGVFNIAIGNMDHQIDFVVMNAQGQEVYSGQLDGSQELDLSAEPKGVYFIRFIDESVLGIEKLVIK